MKLNIDLSSFILLVWFVWSSIWLNIAYTYIN